MNINKILVILLIIFTAIPVYAEKPYYTDGSGLDGYVISKSSEFSDKVNITTMRLSNSLDLSDNMNIDDGAAIEEAISKIKTGQALYLPKGTYNLSRVINLKSGKSIVGEDKINTFLKVKDGTTGAVIKGDASKDCVVENLTLTSDWAGQYSLSTTNKNTDAGQLKFGVLLYSAARVTVRNLIIEKFNTAGIAVCSGNDCRIKNNMILNATDLSGDGHGYGILFQDRNGNDDGVEKSVIEENYLKGPYLRHGVLLQAFSNHNEIKNNQFEEIRLDAVDLHGEGEHHNEIMGNKIYGGGESGIGVGNGPVGTHGASGEYNYIHDNEISECVYGVTVMMGSPNTVIAENIISSSKKTAIRLRYSNSTVIYGNKFYNMPSALLFQKESEELGSSENVVFENNIADNVKTVCVIEKNAAEEAMFSSISDNSFNTDNFISVEPSDNKYLTIVAGYYDSKLAGIGIGNDENCILQKHKYDKISYFQWNPKTLEPKCASKVLYDITKQ